MKVLISGLIVVNFFIWRCSHTHVLHKESENEFISQLNEKAVGKEGEVVTKDRNMFKAKNIQVSDDTIIVEDLEAQETHEIASDELQKITFQEPRSSANGFLYGALTGFIIGGALGYMSGDDESAFISYTASDKALMLGTVMGLGFGIIGAIVGAPGEQNIFVFDKSGASPKYYLLRDIRIIDETELSIHIEWQDKSVWLDKTAVTLRKTDNGIDIRIPYYVYRKRFL